MPPLIVELRPSWQLVVALALLHLTAVGAVVALTLPWPARVALALIVLTSLVLSIRGLKRQGTIRLRFDAKGHCEIQAAAYPGAGETAHIAPETTIYPGFVVLVLCLSGRKMTYVIMPDSTDADSRRRLRVWLGKQR